VATWECKHGNIDLTIGQFGLCNFGKWNWEKGKVNLPK
jgi:hypothetical protein